MGDFKAPQPVQLIAGIIANPDEGVERVRRALEAALGPVEMESPVWQFSFTDYYARAMGNGLLRQFVAFAGLREIEGLHRTKIASNGIEADLAASSRAGVGRPINIDPGYICNSKLILFSSKDFSHRIYIGDGVYAESTIEWRGKGFVIHPWTFPDYRTDDYRNFFASVRVMYRRKLKEAGATGATGEC